MRHLTAAVLLTLAVTTVVAQEGQVAFPRVDVEIEWGENLLLNPGFESDENLTPWQQGYEFDEQVKRSGQRSIRCEITEQGVQTGATHDIDLNQERARPVLIGGWSKAENVSGSKNRNYGAWADSQYQDGSSLWGQAAPFEVGTHDWQYAEKIIWPAKPLQVMDLHALFRGHTGTVWFDDFIVKQGETAMTAARFDGNTYLSSFEPPAVDTAVAEAATGDGLTLGLDANGLVASLRMGQQELSVPAQSGFYLRDAAADSAVMRFGGTVAAAEGGPRQEGEVLGVELTAHIVGRDGYLDISGRVHDTTGEDRAVTVYFALPLEATGGRWCETLATSSEITDSGEVQLSRYPWGVLTTQDFGLCLAMPLDCPRVFRIGYNSDFKQLFIAFDFGLTPETRKSPSSADFRFIFYQFEPEWGLRAALARYYALFPQWFEKRVEREGIWMPFGSIKEVPGWEDFGFAFHELGKDCAWDNEQGIYTFAYCEPQTYWMPMAEEVPRTYEAALAQLKAQAGGEAEVTSPHRRRSRSILRCGDEMADGRLWHDFANRSWCNGVVFAANPDPELPEDDECPTNQGHLAHTTNFNFDRGENGVIDGRYIDSMPNWGSVENYRREHFAHVDLPLTFSPETKRPIIRQVFSTWELSKFVSDDCHSKGKLMIGNGGTHFAFFAPLVDMTGNECGYSFPESSLSGYRMLVYQKPYCLLLNTDFRKLGENAVEGYLNQCMRWGHFGSIFQGNLFVEGKWERHYYWTTPELYERDRVTFKKYVPVMKTIAAAGWEPVTHARAVTEEVSVERFGPDEAGAVYLAVHNAGDARAVSVTVQTDALALPANLALTEMVEDLKVTATAAEGGVTARLIIPSASCRVLKLAP